MAMAVYKPDPVQFLTERKAYHQIDHLIQRRFEDEGEGYLVGLTPNKAFISFSGSKEWRHLREALTFLPGTINGMPALSSLGCHAGYLRVAEQVPDLIGTLQRMGYQQIVLCGHSRGGALAHLVLLLHLYRGGVNDDPVDSPSDDDDDDPSGMTDDMNSMDADRGARKPASVRAFAYGSPFVVNEAVSKYLTDRNLHHRFLSIVNDGDVIPGAMSTLGGLSASDLPVLTGKLSGVDIDGLFRTVGPLLGAAIGYPIPAALGTAVTGFLWSQFWSLFVSSPILTYRPIGRYVFLRKKYGTDSLSVVAANANQRNQYLTTPDTTDSLEAVLVHFQAMAREFSMRQTHTVAELHRHHSYDSYLIGIRSTFGVGPVHRNYWRAGQTRAITKGGRGVRVPGEWHPIAASPNASDDEEVVDHERSPELAQELMSPVIGNVIGQQVLGAGGVGPRRLKLDIIGHNLDLIDLKSGIVLDRFYVDPVVFHAVIAKAKDKMVVEGRPLFIWRLAHNDSATVENVVERLSRGSAAAPVVVIKSIHQGAKPIHKRLTVSGIYLDEQRNLILVQSMVTIDSESHRVGGAPASPQVIGAPSLADGTVFDVAINAFKRAVINRSHELRAERMGFTAQRGVQDRLLEVKSAFERLEALCPGPPGSRIIANTGGTSVTQSSEAKGTDTPNTPKGGIRSLSELIENLARVDSAPELEDDENSEGGGAKANAASAALVPVKGAGPVMSETSMKERETAQIVMTAMDEGLKRCGSFLQSLCSRIDITLEPSMYFVVGTGVVTGLVTALSIGLLLPEAPLIAAGIGMGFLTSTAVGPLGLGDKVIHAVQREQDNAYRFLLMELVKWIGVPAASTRLEFLNAYTHELAIEERLLFLGFDGKNSADVRDPKRWTNWESETPGNGALFSEELFGPGKQFDRATRGCLTAIAKRVEMVRQIHRLRRLIVEETVVALVGTQDTGKTTAARALFPHVDREFPTMKLGQSSSAGTLKRRGMFEHTTGVRVFPHGSVAIADFPGSDSPALALDQAMRRFGGVASVALLFCHFNGDASGEVLRNLEEIKEWSSRIPILLCIHQAGNKVNEDQSSPLFNSELTSVDDVNHFINRWKTTIEARFPHLKVVAGNMTPNAMTPLSPLAPTNPFSARAPPSTNSSPPHPLVPNVAVGTSSGITVVMTEFMKNLRTCRRYGIWGVGEVRGWIRERILESNLYVERSNLMDVIPDEEFDGME
ncbi:hypothetical protein HK101_010197 [Irineochytrium annulatum]|nr:hypothetical protein HK101_010197 [Irineochytrium annulatum]